MRNEKLWIQYIIIERVRENVVKWCTGGGRAGVGWKSLGGDKKKPAGRPNNIERMQKKNQIYIKSFLHAKWVNNAHRNAFIDKCNNYM